MGHTILEIRQPGRKPLQVVVAGELEVGRDCDGLLLVDEEVSRRHARFADEGGVLMVDDLGSTNGTALNGREIDRPMVMGAGDVVLLGATEVRVLSGDARASAPGSRSTTVAGGGPRGTVMKGDPTNVVVVGPQADATAQARATSIDRVAAAVEEERPDAESLAADGDTVTIVFSDIEASTERAMALGDQQWFRVLGTHNEIVRRRVKEFGGREIKSQGDGFMLTFPSARRAVQCCIAIQRDLTGYADDNPETGVRVRMGVHTGEAIVDAGGDLFGKHIIVAARIANLADGGQVLASGVTAEITSSRGDLAFGEPIEVELKGIGGTYRVCDVLWEDGGA